MVIRQMDCDRALAIALSGKLDWETAGELEPRLLAAIDAHPGNLILDMSELEFLSSGGLRVILAAAKKVRSTNSRTMLASVRPFVKQVLEISGATGMLQVFNSVDEALASS